MYLFLLCKRLDLLYIQLPADFFNQTFISMEAIGQNYGKNKLSENVVSLYSTMLATLFSI